MLHITEVLMRAGIWPGPLVLGYRGGEGKRKTRIRAVGARPPVRRSFGEPFLVEQLESTCLGHPSIFASQPRSGLGQGARRKARELDADAHQFFAVKHAEA